jgi:hypothetical protein
MFRTDQIAQLPAHQRPRSLVQVDLTVATTGEQIQGIYIGRSGVELTDRQTLVAVVTRQHDLTFEEYRGLAFWLLVRGCNLLSPHAFYYSIRRPSVDERPRGVGPNSPWRDRYPGFSEMTAKLCWVNTDSEHICSVAILGQDARLPWEAACVCFFQ